jgi:hypothetical protein
LWANIIESEEANGFVGDGSVSSPFVGLILARCSMESHPAGIGHTIFDKMVKASLKDKKGWHELVGYLTWHIYDILGARGDSQPPLGLASETWLKHRGAQRLKDDGLLEAPGDTFSDYFDQWVTRFNFQPRVIIPIFWTSIWLPRFSQNPFVSCMSYLCTATVRFFRKRFLRGSPSIKMIQRWIKQVPDGSAATPARSIIRPQCQSIRCETVLAWLRAAKFITHGHQIGKARKTFQDLEEELQPELVHTERGNPYSYSSLRRQRANLDIVCMNLFRLFWMTMDWSTVHIMVHLDASPQWRGTELLAGSFDLIIRNVAYFCQHRYFPQLRIGPALFTVRGKCFALLWMIWLMVGPSFRAVRAFCDRVTFIVSDYGSEHKIPDLPDLLPDFFQKIGVDIPAPIADIRQKFLFPQGLLLPGWHHVFDGLVRWGLFTLDCFGEVLLIIKSWLHICRNHVQDISKELLAAGLTGADLQLKKITFTTFARWRWRKLAMCCRVVARAMGILLSNVAIAPFKRFLASVHDKDVTKNVLRSIDNKAFQFNFNCVNWFACVLTENGILG